jgi:DNA-binding transcriptional ArsR family regulator
MAEMREQPEMAEVRLEEILRALADPVRLGIARTLCDGAEHACHEFGEGLTRATMSHHFRTLRMAGLISTRAVGRQRFIRLRADELEIRFPGLIRLLNS